MPEKDPEIQPITIRLKAPTRRELAAQLDILNAQLARTAFTDITCTHYTKPKAGLCYRARVTALGPLPELIQFASDLAKVSFDV